MDYRNIKTVLLIERCIEKDPLAWAEFIRRFSPLISLAIRKTLDQFRNVIGPEEARDMEQDILFSLWDKNRLADVKNRENINFWLAITARNSVINLLKARRRELLVSDESFMENVAERNRGSLPYDTDSPDRDKQIKKAYESLKIREKLLFRLYFEREMSLKDISDIMKLPLGTVSSIITRIRKKIKCSKT